MSTTQKAGLIEIKHERIFADVKDQIIRGELPPGAALPSQADLMRDYGVALGTIRQVLNRLQSEGLISSHRGKGSFVRERDVFRPNGNTSATVGCVTFDNCDDTEYDQLVAMRTALSKDNIEMQVGIFSPHQVEHALEWTRSMVGVMIWGRPPIDFVHRLATNGMPTVRVGNMHQLDCPPGVSQVDINLPGAMDMAVQYLELCGHRRILFVNRGGRDGVSYPEFLHQLSVLFDETVRRRIADAVHSELAIDANEVHRLIAHLDAADVPPTALVIEGGQRACGIMHQLEKARWSAPDRISVVAISPLNKSKLAHRELSYVELTKTPLARRSAEVMLEMLRERRTVRESVSPVLHWGNTCRRITE